MHTSQKKVVTKSRNKASLKVNSKGGTITLHGLFEIMRFHSFSFSINVGAEKREKGREYFHVCLAVGATETLYTTPYSDSNDANLVHIVTTSAQLTWLTSSFFYSFM